jgi:hypothetical protein
MLMKILLHTTSQVVGFSASIGENWGDNYGRPEIQNYIDREIIPRINTESAEEWTVTFEHLFVRSDAFGIFKQGRNYLSDKEKVFTITTPIPDRSPDIPWGIRQGKFEIFRPIDPEKYVLVKFDYENYDGIKEYIMDCTVRVLHDFFTQGFTVAGEKIKFIKI